MWGLISTIVVTVIAGVILYKLQLKIKENNDLKKEKETLKKQQKERKTQHEMAIENGILCILRKHLMDEHNYWMEKKYITSTALESGLAMYGAYKMLGGNGMIDHMKDDIEELPIRD